MSFPEGTRQRTTLWTLAGGFVSKLSDQAPRGCCREFHVWGIVFNLNTCNLAEKTEQHLAIQRTKNWKQHDAMNEFCFDISGHLWFFEALYMKGVSFLPLPGG